MHAVEILNEKDSFMARDFGVRARSAVVAQD
jgi:hypothetical protein